MKLVARLRLMLLLMPLLWSLIPGAQTMPRMHFGDPQTPLVSFTEFDAATSPVFEKVFISSPKHAAVRAVSFVVTNKSPKSIIGVAFQYRILDSSHRESFYALRTHSYLSPTAEPLMRPNEQMLVSPDSFIPESVSRPGRGIAGTLPHEKTIAQFSSASEVFVTIDAIVFDDGEVVGPNDLQLVQDMQHLKGAADVIQKQVDSALASGQDPRDSLRQLEATPRLARDPIAKDISRLLSQLLLTEHFDSVYKHVKRIQSQPLFFRKDGKSL